MENVFGSAFACSYGDIHVGLIISAVFACLVAVCNGWKWSYIEIGIGGGLGIPTGIVAGAVISGAYFGDKMSPLSDTTNMASAVAGVNIFEHIHHMVYTITPTMVIGLILYAIIDIKYSGGADFS